MFNIVIVEDEELEREAVREILSDNLESINIIGEARNGSQALELIDSNDIDLMLVDINIPQINGLDVVKYLRQKQKNTKVIIITAYDHFDMTRTAIQLKVDEYLLKPIREQALLTTVRSSLMELGSGRLCKEMLDRINELLEQKNYQEGVAVARWYADWICSQQEYPQADVVRDFVSAFFAAIQKKGLRLPTDVSATISELQKNNFSEFTSAQIQSLFLRGIDVLFNVDSQTDDTDVIQKALNYIERNLKRRVSLEETADYVNISSCYLSRMFKKELSVNFISYLTLRRIELAKDMLLKTDLSVTNIAMDLSYNDVNYFCKSFKKEVGLPPSEFRDSCRNSA